MGTIPKDDSESNSNQERTKTYELFRVYHLWIPTSVTSTAGGRCHHPLRIIQPQHRGSQVQEPMGSPINKS